MSLRSDIIGAFATALRVRPLNFTADRHRLKDEKTGQEWWVANDAFGFHLEVPIHIEFGFWEKRRAWRAFKSWKEAAEIGELNAIFRALTEANERTPT